MKKLYTVTKDRKRFYVCKYGENFYTIDRITKSFGGIIKAFNDLKALEQWATANGYKRAHNNARTEPPTDGGAVKLRKIKRRLKELWKTKTIKSF